jgi:nucleotide-binding universal stress UspA family protein
VLLAGLGKPFSPAAIRRAGELAGQAQGAIDPLVAVLTIAKVYGSSFGLPNPGLMPTKKERDAQVELLEDTIASLRKLGVTADGQVAVTRKILRTIVHVAQLRQAEFVVMDDQGGSPLRRWLEGDAARYIGRKLAPNATVEVVASSAT